MPVDPLTTTFLGSVNFAGGVQQNGAPISNRFADQGAAKTASYSMSAWDRAEYNTTSGAISQALPSSPAAGDQVIVYLASGTNTLTLTGTGGPFTIKTAGHGVTMFWTGTAWKEQQDRKTAASLDKAYGSVVSALDPQFGVVGDGIADDRDGLRAWAAAANGKHAYLPKGTYKTSGTIVFTDVATNVFGEGYRSRIVTTANTISGLVLGNPATHGGTANNSVTADVGGGAPVGVRVSGSIKDICVESSPLSPPALRNGSIGIQVLDGIQATVERCTANGFDIGLDLNGNCYGAEINNCRTTFGQNNVGLNIRTGGSNGSDQSFINNWFQGNYAAVHIAGGNGGFHFWGGQMSVGYGFSSAQDNNGAVITCKDYLTDTVLSGQGNIQFRGVSFEGWHYTWAVRSYGETALTFDRVNFNPTNNQCIGVMKMTNANASVISFKDCTLGFGPYSSPSNKLLDVSGQSGGLFQCNEVNWSGSSGIGVGSATGVDIRKTTLALQAGLVGNSSGTNGSTVDGLYESGVQLSTKYARLTPAVNTQNVSGFYALPATTSFLKHRLTLTAAGNIIVLPAPVAGTVIDVDVIQDGVGTRAYVFPNASWGGGTTPTPSTGANKVDAYRFKSMDGATWEGLSPIIDVTGSSLMAMWRASAITGLADGAAVTSWPDSSGRGNTLAQLGSAALPIYKTAITNGQPVVRFNRTTGQVIGMNSGTILVGPALTLIFVYQVTGDAGTSRNLLSAANINQGCEAFIFTNDHLVYARQGQGYNGDSGIPSLNTWYVASFVHDGTNHTWYVNGASVATGSSTPGLSADAYRLGARYISGTLSNAFTGDIAEVQMYKGALSTNDRHAIELALGSIYGITIA